MHRRRSANTLRPWELTVKRAPFFTVAAYLTTWACCLETLGFYGPLSDRWSLNLIGVHPCSFVGTLQIMNRFINILTGWVAFACLLVLGKTGGALNHRASNEPMVLMDYVFLGVVVVSVFFLQYALDRYLIPPNVFTKEQRKGLLEGAEAGYRKTFFRVALGLIYFFLILYAWEYLRADPLALERKNWMLASIFFLVLGMVGRARGIILHLAGKETWPAQASVSGTTG